MRIYIDMDGVISDFQKAAEEGGFNKRPDLHVNYRNLEVIEEWDREYLEQNKIAVRFECKQIGSSV